MQARTTPQCATAEDEAGAISRATPLTRELSVRDNDGIHVLLLGQPHKDKMTVSVEDSGAGQRFDLETARTPRRGAMPHVRGGIIDQRDHDHDGRCSGRLRIVAGVLVGEIVCDDCGAVVQTLGSGGTYQLMPTGIERAA